LTLMNDAQIMDLVTLVEQAEEELQHGNEGDALHRLDAAMDTIRQAFAQAVAQPDPTLALRLAGGLWRYWHIRGTLADGHSWLEQALAGSEHADPALRAKALDGAGVMTMDQGRLAESRAYHQQALALYQELGDTRLVAGNYESLGCLAMLDGDPTTAAQAFEQSLALRQQRGGVDSIVSTLLNLTSTAVLAKDLPAAQTWMTQARSYEAQITSDQLRTHLLACAAMLAFEAQDYAQTTALSRETLRQSLARGATNQVLLSLEGLAAAAIETNQPVQAARLYGAASVRYDATGIPATNLANPDRPARIARGAQQLGAEQWATLWEAGRQMDAAALLAAVGAEA
jgi:tetratricopeptide (TPR) repeat protein